MGVLDSLLWETLGKPAASVGVELGGAASGMTDEETAARKEELGLPAVANPFPTIGKFLTAPLDWLGSKLGRIAWYVVFFLIAAALVYFFVRTLAVRAAS